MTWELLLAGLVLACLVLYALLAGADFGGGVWDLLATGPRADDQRRVIERAMGPVWEANHVWLIAILVLLFTSFPRAYATIGTALHLPLTLMLGGIVLRGTAFVFRHYDSHRTEVWRSWSRLFAVTSVITPFMLGVCLGAAASGQIRVDAAGRVAPEAAWAWLAAFPLAVGALTVAVFAFLAAVYLLAEVDDPELQRAFRKRALGASAAVTALAWLTFFAAAEGAPHLRAGLWSSAWALPFQALTGALGAGILTALVTQRRQLARALAALQVAALACGFGAAQYPYIVTPDITFTAHAAPQAVLQVVGGGMVVGLVLLLPAYLWLLRVFHAGGALDKASPEDTP
jgi:cytochrome d ubiquinol oxidase subunit II